MGDIVVILPEEVIYKRKMRRDAAAPDEFVRKYRSRLGGTNRARDPLFANIKVWQGDCPSDLAVRHDDYLYGDDQ
jgi:hypothetical protein